MKNTFSPSSICLLLLPLIAVFSQNLSAQNISLDADFSPVFIKPKSETDNTDFKLGIGYGVNMMLKKHLKNDFDISGGITFGRLWYKETSISVLWPDDVVNGTRSVYDRKFRVNEFGPLVMLQKKLTKKTVTFSPTAGVGYSWFFGEAKYEKKEGSGEKLVGRDGRLGTSFNVHAGFGLRFKISERRTLGFQPVFSYRFGEIETTRSTSFGTTSFQPHTLAFDIMFMSLLFKDKTETKPKE
ncbi:MAG: hypothetical protein MUC59_09340 [Saprospiraceae bacterium]|jgi:hypothetical protein|nr:hypothetical protein [Saprospiraceae bacterium]